MSINKDFHIHTVFSDGKGTPEETIVSAIEKGMTAIGFSDHSTTDFDMRYCMPKDKDKEYLKEINRLKVKYADKIKVYAGIEQDYYSAPTDLPYDYKIGSVHYICKNGIYFPVDSAKNAEEGVLKLHGWADELYNGDIYALVEDYYENVGNVVEKTGADLIGHFDLVSKFNKYGTLLDETNERYINAGIKAIDKLLKTGKPFEMNTGPILRGYKTHSYPCEAFRTYIAEHGGKFVFSSDSHTPFDICYYFDKLEEIKGIEVVDLF